MCTWATGAELHAQVSLDPILLFTSRHGKVQAGNVACSNAHARSWHCQGRGLQERIRRGVVTKRRRGHQLTARTDCKLWRRQRQLPQRKAQAGGDEQDGEEAVQGAQPVPCCPLDVVGFQYLRAAVRVWHTLSEALLATAHSGVVKGLTAQISGLC